MRPVIPADDKARVAALRSLELLDTPPEQEFDAVVKLASEICEVPIALVSLVDEERQWFKARVGLDVPQTSRAASFCQHAILSDEPMIVPSATEDPRFAENPLVLGEPHVKFYAGIPLRMASGHNVGTLCVVDQRPRTLSSAQLSALRALAHQVERLLELRRSAIAHREMIASLQATDDALRRGDSAPAEPLSRWSRGAFVLAFALAVASVFASFSLRRTTEAAGQARLQHATERAATALDARLRAYIQILRGVGALFRASERVSASEFSAYVNALLVERSYAGLLGLGFAERVERADLEAWLSGARRETPDLHVTTSGDAPFLVINRLVEPLEINRRALGFDIASEPLRVQAITAAERINDVTLTRRVRLRQDATHGPGFIMYLPVPTTGDVSKPARGWVFAAVRARDLVNGLEEAAGADLLLAVDDAEGVLKGGAASNADQATFATRVRVADHVFTLRGQPGRKFYARSERSEPWVILVLGLGAALLAFALTTSMRRTEARSHEIAVRMTHALRRGEQELRAANAALEQLATLDALTGLSNRRVFDERIHEEVLRARRNSTPLSLVLIDVDHFKLYNDRYGHQDGDECLKQVSACVRSVARRAGEVASRYGGEELALILPGSDRAAAVQTAELARQRIADLKLAHEKSPFGFVTASLGVATYVPEATPEAADLIKAADKALYEAKHAGRNRVLSIS